MCNAYCRSWGFVPLMKENEPFVRCAIINTRNLKLVMRVIQIKLQGMHVYLRALNEITAWKKRGEKQTRLINNDSCVQESQLVGLNHYLAGAHLTFSFCFKKPGACKWSEILLQLSMLGREGAVLKYNFIRINHNLHDFSVIHSHLKLNFIDAWREPSLWVVHCQWTSWAGGGSGWVGWSGGRATHQSGGFFCVWQDWGINDRKILVGMRHSASCECV